MLHYLLAIFGIGLVIFVHELGHFLAARFCGVRVETFSIGMGPRILSWKWGDTQWQLALLPIGGYVKMAGDEISTEEAEADISDTSFDHLYGDDGQRIPQDDELGSKSIGQRFLIFAGGVIMNVIFGLVVFPIVLLAGVPFIAPVMGAPALGSPAWEAGLEAGTEFLAVDGADIFAFTHIPAAIALGDSTGMDMTIRRPGKTESEVIHIVPEKDETFGLNVIGIGPEVDPDFTLSVSPGSPAELAGIKNGDRLLAVRGGEPDLPLPSQLNPFLSDQSPLELKITGVDGERWVTVTPDLSQLYPTPLVGISAPTNRVLKIRGSGLASEFGLQIEDCLLAVGSTELLQAQDLQGVLIQSAGKELELTVLREGRQIQLRHTAIAADEVPQLISDIAFTSDTESTRVVVSKGSAAERSGMKTGDRVVRIDGTATSVWEDLRGASRSAGAMSPPSKLTFSVQRQPAPGAALQMHEFKVTPEKSVMPNYGIGIGLHQYVYQATNPLMAFRVGTECTLRFLQDSWIFMQRIVSGEVSGENAGGIITIGKVSSDWAQEGISKLFFFLCILSMNLAFLNVLPIPLLDGGHMLFLLIEKIKGSPVSARVQVLSQMVGMFLLLFLMIYVTYNDVVRWFG
jgi:regulator of sigma E protease